MVDIEVKLVQAYTWSLYDIDRTDIESLLPFIGRLAGPGLPAAGSVVYCDQVSWL
jgi:hypothetical protein